MQTIQIPLSQKQNLFSSFFSAFFESTLNFEDFQKKMTLIGYVFSKVPSRKDALRLLSRSSHLRDLLERRHGKRAQTLAQSE